MSGSNERRGGQAGRRNKTAKRSAGGSGKGGKRITPYRRHQRQAVAPTPIIGVIAISEKAVADAVVVDSYHPTAEFKCDCCGGKLLTGHPRGACKACVAAGCRLELKREWWQRGGRCPLIVAAMEETSDEDRETDRVAYQAIVQSPAATAEPKKKAASAIPTARKCYVAACPTIIGPDKFFCATHWKLVPPQVQAELQRAISDVEPTGAAATMADESSLRSDILEIFGEAQEISTFAYNFGESDVSTKGRSNRSFSIVTSLCTGDGKIGAPAKFDFLDIVAAVKGGKPVIKVAREMKCTRSTVYRALSNEGELAPRNLLPVKIRKPKQGYSGRPRTRPLAVGGLRTNQDGRYKIVKESTWCTQCEKRPKIAGKSRCIECQEYQRQRSLRRAEKLAGSGLCRQCKQPWSGSWRCPPVTRSGGWPRRPSRWRQGRKRAVDRMSRKPMSLDPWRKLIDFDEEPSVGVVQSDKEQREMIAVLSGRIPVGTLQSALSEAWGRRVALAHPWTKPLPRKAMTESEWAMVPIGTASDGVIGELHDIAPQTIYRRRKLMGIPAYVPPDHNRRQGTLRKS